MKFLFSSLLLLTSLLTPHLSFGQTLGQFDVVNGLQRYPLGSGFDASDTLLRLVGKHEYKGRTEYSYLYPKAFDNPYELGGVNLKNAILTYESNKLIRILFINLYTPKLYPDFKKKAKREAQQLYSHLKAQWNTKGKKKPIKKSPDGMYVAREYEWNLQQRVMKLYFSEDNGKQRGYTIQLTLELEGYQ